MSPDTQADLAVVGAGAAGLYAALCAAREGARVVLVSATPLAQTASYWAQGGLAAALAADDTPERHLADTERAGRELVRRSAAEILVREAPACVEDLQSLGVRFDADRFGRLALGLEGGHSIRRIVHAGGSATGRRLVRQLSALAAENQRIQVFEGARARALWTDAEPGERPSGGEEARCRGLLCEEWHGNGGAPRAGSGIQRNGETPFVVSARAVVLATGGAAALWARTTNPPGSQGVGLLLAHAAGARLADLELLQFHPTAAIGVPGREGFLVTEAIRGEGATLHDSGTGERFVDELLPRDEVSRAIQARLRESGASAVGLDMRAIDPAHFPNVVAALREAGLDPTRELVPVAPAAHYAMGGIAVDLHARANVAGLYAVGEVSCTGLHGANRLASNSLSECFVFARRAVSAALSEPAPASPTPGEMGRLLDAPPIPAAEPATRAALWRDAGIERTGEGLRLLLKDPHPLARLIARCALAREESRGAHLRVDHPERDPALDHRHAVVAGEEEVSWETWE
ncbi:MAG TPA: FAD-dependent oxidoreductase [Solirubrobacteraceae bacterium]|nr:FAD-dependent oxidoreductase [Solirubrobacteraceae bacterium]